MAQAASLDDSAEPTSFLFHSPAQLEMTMDAVELNPQLKTQDF